MKKILTLLVVLTCFNLSSYCQGNGTVLQNVVAKLKTLSGDHIVEKAYLHFDKPYYAAGDTMYFKAYVTLGERHDLSKSSGILYVDLISPQNNVISTIKPQLVDGLGWGDFALPNSLQKGNYRVRAYTKYMQNDPDFFFDQVIPIGSVNSNNVAENSTPMAQNGKADIQFFPEGGDLINNLVSKVAFKAIGTNGLGVNVKGVILDNTNKELGKFSSSHLGMGTFYIEPEEGKTYKAKLTFADGSQSTVDLPKAQAEGIVLAVKDTLGKISIEMRCNKAYLKNNQGKELNLVIYSGGMVTTANTKLDNTDIGMDVPNKNFTTGIVQVTLFSQTGEPLSERLLFLQNPDLLNVAVNSDKASYKQRDKVQMKINAKSGDGLASSGHFSVAVIDESKVKVDENAEHTILTDLLLTGELKGYVEQPNYYFTAKNTQADLDALMLTQGYRRFNWKNLLSSPPAFTYHSENNFHITGEAKTADGSPLVKKPVMMRASSPSTFNGNIFTAETDENGKFKFENLLFMDTAKLILQPEISKGKTTTQLIVDGDMAEPPIAPNSAPIVTADVNALMPAYLDNARERGLALNSNSTLLKPVKVEDKKPAYRTLSLSGAGNADQVIKGDDVSGFPSLSLALGGKLHGSYIKNGVPYLNSNRTINAGMVTEEPMLVVMDGVPTDGDIDNIAPSNVETIELLTNQNAAIYGIRGAAGVLVITTRQTMPVIEGKATGMGILQFKRYGLYKAREFYSPKYESNVQQGRADLRATILWKPEVVTDKDGNASFEYFNADSRGSYRLVIEGVDEKGNIGRQVYRYKVE